MSVSADIEDTVIIIYFFHTQCTAAPGGRYQLPCSFLYHVFHVPLVWKTSWVSTQALSANLVISSLSETLSATVLFMRVVRAATAPGASKKTTRMELDEEFRAYSDSPEHKGLLLLILGSLQTSGSKSTESPPWINNILPKDLRNRVNYMQDQTVLYKKAVRNSQSVYLRPRTVASGDTRWLPSASWYRSLQIKKQSSGQVCFKNWSREGCVSKNDQLQCVRI